MSLLPHLAFGDSKIQCMALTANLLSAQKLHSYVLPKSERQIVKFALLYNPKTSAFDVRLIDGHRYSFHSQYLKAQKRWQDLKLEEIDALAAHGNELIYGSFEIKGSKVSIELQNPLGQISKSLLNELKKLLSEELESVEYSVVDQPQSVVQHSSSAGKLVNVFTPQDLETLFREGEISSESILVLHFIPEDIPPVGGLILKQPISPANHLMMYAAALNIPVWTPALNDFRALADRNGQKVILEATDSTIVPRFQFTNDEYLLALPQRPKKKTIPAINSAYSKIKNIASIIFSETDRYGAKTAQLAEVRNIYPGSVSRSLGIPIHYFVEYMRTARTSSGIPLFSEVATRIENLVSASYSTAMILSELDRIRQLILDTPIPTEIFARIEKEIIKNLPRANAFRLRSSSNAEDRPNFNGAGLYDSVEVTRDHLNQGLRQVWASLYNPRAFFARRHFDFDEHHIGMGILVQESETRLKENAVSLVQLNQGQLDMVSDIVSNSNGGSALAVRSSVTEGRRVWKSSLDSSGQARVQDAHMSEQVQIRISKIFFNLYRRWKKLFPSSSGIEIEWGIKKDDQIVIFQVRPLPIKIESNQPDSKPSSIFYRYYRGEDTMQGVVASRLSLLPQAISLGDIKMSSSGDLEISHLELIGGIRPLSFQNLKIEARKESDKETELFEFLIPNYLKGHQTILKGFLRRKKNVVTVEGLVILDTNSRKELLEIDYSSGKQMFRPSQRSSAVSRTSGFNSIRTSNQEPKEIEILVRSAGSRSGESGNFHDIFSEVKIRGLISDTLDINPHTGIVFVPGHHNRWSYTIIDLHQTVRPLSSRTLKSLDGLRFLMITKDRRGNSYRVFSESELLERVAVLTFR